MIKAKENAKQLRPTYATEDNALATARAEWQRMQRGLAESELTLAIGRADLLPDPAYANGLQAPDRRHCLADERGHALSK